MLRTLFQFDRASVRPWTAVRCTVGFAAPILVASAMGRPSLGVLASLGALYAGMASFSGVYHHRLRLMLTSSFVMSAVTLLGCFLSPRPDLAVVVVGLVAFVLALFASAGPAATTVAIQGTGVLVVISGIRATADMPFGNAGLVLAGGLFQTLLLTAVWPVFGTQPERRAVAAVFAGLARHLTDLTAGTAPPIPDASAFQTAWDLMAQTERFSPKLAHAQLRQALATAEAFRAGLVGLGRAYEHVGPDPRNDSVVADLGSTLERVAEAIRRDASLVSAVASDTIDVADEPQIIADERDLDRWARLLRRFLAQIGEPNDEEIKDPKSRPFVQATGDAVVRSYREFSDLVRSVELRSLAAKHALRYGLAVATAVGLSQAWGISHAYWLPLTVALILRVDYAATLDRGLARLVGTIAGVGIAGVLATAMHPTTAMNAGMMIVAGWVACTLYLANYMFYSVAITLYVVSSVSASGAHAHGAGMDRLTATLLGVLLAVLANVVIPIWQSGQVAAILREALQAQIGYGEAVLALHRGEADSPTEETRRRARTMRIEAERITVAAQREPRWGRSNLPSSAADVLASLDENAAILLALNAEAVAEPHSPRSEIADQQIESVISKDRKLDEGLRRPCP